MKLRVSGGLSGISGDAFSSSSGSAFHPIFQQDLNYRVDVVGDDPDGQVGATIRLMRTYKDEDASSPEIMREAQWIQEQTQSEVYATCMVWRATKAKIGFLRDEVTSQSLDFLSQTYSAGMGGADVPIVEVLVRPRDMATMKVARYGDCDDFAMYAASLLTALGIPNSFVTLAGDDKNQNIFSHVYVAAYPRDSNGDRVRVAVDASHGEYCGWEAPKPFARKQEWGGPQDDTIGIGFACLLGIAAIITAVALAVGGLK